MTEPRALRAVELFTGAGGLALGIANSGFEHHALIEFNRQACDSIRLNQSAGHPVVKDFPLHQGDVRAFSYEGLENITLVAGGPPCQPFSIGGKHKGSQDARDMFPEAVRAVRELRPAAFVFENVKGLLRQSFAGYFEYIVLQLTHPEVTRKAGEEWADHRARLERHHTSGGGGMRYNVVYQLLNAANYGVPQKRERVFIVGFRADLGIEWSFPAPTYSKDALLRSKLTGEYWDRHGVAKRDRSGVDAAVAEARPADMFEGERAPWLTVRDAIAGLPDPERGGATTRFKNHVLVPGARSYPGHTGSPLDEPAKTLKAGDHGVPGGENMLLKPDGTVRYFTVREAARLQTFPDDYVFNAPWSETMRQLGNAVPVKLAQAVAGEVARTLGRDS